jgi:acyl-CoA thioesterase FadM
VKRRLEWMDTDAAQHWHSSAALRMSEWAEQVLFDRLGLIEYLYGEDAGLPRVHVELEFHTPLYFNDEADVELRVAHVGRTSIRFETRISRGDALCADLRVTAVHRRDGLAAPWPDDLRTLLTTAGPQ